MRLIYWREFLYSWLQSVSRKPVGEYSIGADEIVGGHVKSVLDPSFRYTPSFNTDLQKTFARIRHDHRQEAEKAVQAAAGALAKVSSIVRKTATGR